MTDKLNSVFCMKREKAIHQKYYITFKEHHDIGDALGDAGVLLYIHYLRMASTKNPDLSDDNTSRSLGWNLRKVRRYRSALTSAGYYKATNYTRSDGLKGVDHHLGKEAVQELEERLAKK